MKESISQRIHAVMARRGMTQAELVRASGLDQRYVTNVLKRDQRTMDGAIAAQFAAGLGVSVTWLLTGSEDGQVPPAPAPPRAPRAAAASPVPPPASDTRISLTVIRERLDAAFDPSVHRASDIGPVEEALQRSAAFVADHLDPVAYARLLLDAQADARAKGKSVPPDELPMAALGLNYRARVDLQKRLDSMVNEAAQRLILDDASIPPAGTVHPAFKAAQDKARRRGGGR